MNNPQEEHQARTKFITPGILIEGTITEVQVNQDPFHCTIKIQPKDPSLIGAEGRYSDHEISLGKLKRNLVQLKFNIRDVGDIIAAVESLEGRECLFRVDKSGWISWIPRFTESLSEPTIVPVLLPIPAPVQARMEIEVTEVFFIREPGYRSIYRMENPQGGVLGWAVGPTQGGHPMPHGWVLHLATRDQAIEILKQRKKTVDK
jgi:hypothetical protein